MEHVVFFPAADGTPSYRLVADLDDAVRLVEHLRNVEQVADVSVFALTAVPLAFRAYYKVEVAAAPQEAVVEAQPEAPAVEQVHEQVVDRAPVEDAELPPLVTVAEAGPHARNGAPVDVADLGFFAT
ncbi:MAG: hypothetical protein JWM64_496 [Frankiales bacterium]|nr:hypothetical protein [Frankiales bacterium]